MKERIVVPGKVAFYTLGCKLNFSETSTIGEQFISNGFNVVDFKDKADVYVINTCSVTDNADRECRQIVRRALRNNPNAFIAVTGCYAQLRPEEIAGISGVDVILGSNEKFKLFDYIESFEKRELSCVYVSPTENLSDINAAFSTEATGRTRAFLKVQDGCDYTCSYCTIPMARGKSRSIQPGEIINNLQTLLSSGFKEIVLTGVNVGDYGLNTGIDFYRLLTMIHGMDAEFRMRISSIEPNLLTDEIIELARGSRKMCNHFHIPLQSGSTKILKLMQRRYKKEFYRDLIYKLNDRIASVGIGVDVIVGFPGETEDEFLETYEFLNELPVSYLHVFTYSERPDTKAISLPGIVDIAERKRRNSMLRILSEKKRRAFYQKMTGTAQEVVFEHQNHNGMMKGFTSNYVRVQKPYAEDEVNRFIDFTISPDSIIEP
ncbi:MAG: tRNA (N(6)-L-threonylcarbamoyladenosine(37)-C(2))-methylthiotransferase MtaB [Syntrophothermus sp.]